MLKEQRYMAICDELRRNHFVTSQELSERLGISKSTIRRDLLDLEADGKLTRARGGAILKSPFSTEDPLAVLPETELSEKKRIALAALSYIGVNETILLSSGNTCMELAKVLHQKAPSMSQPSTFSVRRSSQRTITSSSQLLADQSATTTTTLSDTSRSPCSARFMQTKCLWESTRST